MNSFADIRYILECVLTVYVAEVHESIFCSIHGAATFTSAFSMVVPLWLDLPERSNGGRALIGGTFLNKINCDWMFV